MKENKSHKWITGERFTHEELPDAIFEVHFIEHFKGVPLIHAIKRGDGERRIFDATSCKPYIPPYTSPEFPYPDTTQLRELAIYLEGVVRGQGDFSPLGTNHLAELWKTIQYLNMNAKT
jgi:hypothetical protein